MNAELIEKKKRIVEHYLKQKILLSRDVLSKLQHQEHIEHMFQEITNGASIPRPTIQKHTIQQEQKYTVTIKKEYEIEKENYTTQDFTKNFTKRFKILEKMLSQRSELINLTSIRRLEQKTERETVSIIGIVYEKSETKKGNIMFTLEDLSGVIRVVVSQKSPAFATARDTQLDEVIGISGSLGNNIIFANTLIYPDVPMATEIKKAPDEVYAVVPSDPQVGSNLFQPERFNNFIEWLSGNHGSAKDREIAKKVGYVLMPGDVVEGVGVFPGQEEELEIPDIYEQYRELTKYIKRIPKHIQVIICSGNHDGVRLAEPQPRISEEFAPDLYNMPNIHLVTNPSLVNIHKTDTFEGFDVLFYHGGSYTFYCDTVQSIKDSGLEISDRTGIIMKYLLQRRHLAPTYGSTRVLPDPEKDNLVIEHLPDFFVSGHIHKAIVTSYRGVHIIVGSCFIGMSAYQAKFGHVPIPGQVPLINLKTRKVSMLEF